MSEATQLPVLNGTPLDRVEKLRDVIIEGGDEAQKLRRLPDHTVDVLIDEGMFRFTLPPELGGEDASALETIEVLEAMSAIDASVGWNVMLGQRKTSLVQKQSFAAMLARRSRASFEFQISGNDALRRFPIGACCSHTATSPLA